MNRNEKQLWNGIKNFKFDKREEDYSFSTKLAYENTWSEKFTKEAILEYRRFMFLAAVSSKMVSPSHIVDIVWHLHLTCSDSYEEFCEVLRKKVKHVPSKGRGKDIDSLKAAVKYTDTKYKQYFRNKNMVIDKVRSFEDVIVIEKPNKLFRKIDNYHLGSLCLLLFLPLYFFWKPIIIKIDNPDFIFIAGIFFLIIISIMYFLLVTSTKLFFNEIKDEKFINYFNEYEILSFLERSSEKLVLLKIDKMFQNGTLKVSDNKKGVSFKRKNQISADKYYYVIKNYIEEYPDNNFKNLFISLKSKRVFKVTEKVGNLLDKKLKESKSFFNIRIYVFVSVLCYFSFVVSRLILGLTRDKIIYYIFIFILITAFAMGLIIYRFFKNKIKSTFINIVKDEMDTSEFIDDYFDSNHKGFNTNLLLLISNNQLSNISSSPSNNWSSCSSCSSGGGGGDGCSSCSSCGGCGGCGD